MSWRERLKTPDEALEPIKPGTSIFLGTGGAEPRTLVQRLIESEAYNLDDLELIQLISFGDTLALEGVRSGKFRLKTFFSGGVASAAISSGQIDVIPSRFSTIPRLVEQGLVPIQAAFVQVSMPNESGYCSLGTAVDIARVAMEQADYVVGELNPAVPRTLGDTYVHHSEFDVLVEAQVEPYYVAPSPVPEVFEQVAANVAALVEDGACVGFTLGPMYDALARALTRKRHLGVHSPAITDAVMELIESGAVTNRRKEVFRGRSLAAYGFGSPELHRWLDGNPLVELQDIQKVFSPIQIGRNPKVVAFFPARKVDVTGGIAMHHGGAAVGPAEAIDFINGAELSEGGRVIFALPSRNKRGEPNILLSVHDLPNELALKEAVDTIVTEYGAAYVRGRTARERAQALIEIAHPDDRPALVEAAKEARILYQDQIFVPESARFYPSEVASEQAFPPDGEVIRFRAIKPSDEEEMRRLFYRFSDQAVYYRYFTRLRAMPHRKMQQYVNVDSSRTLSIVGVVGEHGAGRIVAEARYVRHEDRNLADVAFVVDEQYQGRGIATYMLRKLVDHAKERGIEGFTADVLTSNTAMMKVFEKLGLPVQARIEDGAYALTIRFDG